MPTAASTIVVQPKNSVCSAKFADAPTLRVIPPKSGWRREGSRYASVSAPSRCSSSVAFVIELATSCWSSL